MTLIKQIKQKIYTATPIGRGLMENKLTIIIEHFVNTYLNIASSRSGKCAQRDGASQSNGTNDAGRAEGDR